MPWNGMAWHGGVSLAVTNDWSIATRGANHGDTLPELAGCSPCMPIAMRVPMRVAMLVVMPVVMRGTMRVAAQNI